MPMNALQLKQERIARINKQRRVHQINAREHRADVQHEERMQRAHSAEALRSFLKK